MKKIISILLVFLMALSFAPIAFADEGTGEPVIETTSEDEDNSSETDEGEIDEETQEEIKAMDSQYGAEVRLLQLESAIARNIERGNEVIAKAKELEKDTSDLEAIITEMESLKKEVAAANPAAEDAVQIFVDLKKDAIDLSKQFRDAAREIIPSGEANRLKERIKNENIGEQIKLKERIRERLKEFNAQRLGAMFQKMNIEGQELIEKIRNGEITAREVKAQTMEKFKSMTNEERRNAFAAVKEATVKRTVAARAKADKVKMNYIDRKEIRLTARLENFNKTGKNIESLEKYTRARLENLEQAKERVQSRIEERQQEKASVSTSNHVSVSSQAQQGQQTGNKAGGLK